MRSQQHPPEPPPRRPPTLPFPEEFDGQALGFSASDESPWAIDPRVRIVSWGTTDLSWRPSRWRRFVDRRAAPRPVRAPPVRPPFCVIEVGHPADTPAQWINYDHPEHTVCDRHRQQYDTAYDDYDIQWVPV